MKSPLSLIASIFMRAFEKETVSSILFKPKFRHRYVNSLFTILPHGPTTLTDFLGHLSSGPAKLSSPREWIWIRKILFSYIIIRCLDNSMGYAQIGRYLQVSSHHPPAHKRSIITAIIDRAKRPRVSSARLPDYNKSAL
jgi:hypothetical protein